MADTETNVEEMLPIEYLPGGELKSTMPDSQSWPLLMSNLLDRAAHVNPQGLIFQKLGQGYLEQTFSEHQDMTAQLANALNNWGLKMGDRVSTLMWNNTRHLAIYHAIPCMGCVVNPLNIRLHPDELGWIISNAESRVVFVDETLAKKLQAVDPKWMTTVELIVVCGNEEKPSQFDMGDERAQDYDAFVDGAESTITWPRFSEDAAAALTYTSGTTGKPKGVMYSHRALYLHVFAIASGPSFSIAPKDVLLPVVPMFHVMSWGVPFMILTYGLQCVMTSMFLKPNFLLDMIRDCKCSIAFGVPTLWNGMKQLLTAQAADYEDIRGVLKTLTVGGSSVPMDLIEYFFNEWGVEIMQGWGMTETGPLGSLSRHEMTSRDATDMSVQQRMEQQAKCGAYIPGLNWKIVQTDDFNTEVAQDGEAAGELLIQGPWVTQSYFRRETPEKFHNGFLVTGDISSISATGVMKIEDRSKDLIKTGGEWVSSIDVENKVVEMPQIAQCAVVGVDHPKWVQRPVVVAILVDGCDAPSVDELRAHCATIFAKYQLPDDLIIWDAIPMTGTGKISKKGIRTKLAEENYLLPDLRETTETVA